MKSIYDNPIFFEKYSEMLRSKEGLKGAGEWATLQQILPTFEDKKVLDLGCGYGWHCIYAVSQGATQVVGIDVSGKMLQEAIAKNNAKNIAYRQVGIEDFEYHSQNFDIVISSLALHYIENIKNIFHKIYNTLTTKGTFVFTMEHPIFTAYGSQDWYYNEAQKILHFPVDNYFIEGEREAHFLGEKVIKYHHTLTTILEGLLQAGFIIKHIVEPQPTNEMIKQISAMKNELRRPMMIAISAMKN